MPLFEAKPPFHTIDPDSLMFIGNDVVDLRDPRCVGRSDDSRFLRRIFAPSEAALIRNAENPDRAVWLLWAAKEAAFKVVSKIRRTPPPFAHAKFLVDLVARGSSEGGSVSFEDLSVAFETRPPRSIIHLVGWSAGGGETYSDAGVISAVHRTTDVLADDGRMDLESLREERFTERERGAVHSLPSAAVRIAARAGIAEILGIDEGGLEIVCDGPVGRSPPRLLVQDDAELVDVSLSHHGDWIAWAAVTGRTKRGHAGLDRTTPDGASGTTDPTAGDGS